MAIVGFTFGKVFAQRDKVPKGQIKINHSLNIRDVKKQDVKLEKGKSIVDFLFEFKADYQPEVADMLIQGKVHYMDEDKNIDDILKDWNKNKHVKDEIMTPVINLAFHKSLLKGLELSQDIGIPPIIPMPSISPKNKKAEKYIG